jgi:hypothetical protein
MATDRRADVMKGTWVVIAKGLWRVVGHGFLWLGPKDFR